MALNIVLLKFIVLVRFASSGLNCILDCIGSNKVILHPFGLIGTISNHLELLRTISGYYKTF